MLKETVYHMLMHYLDWNTKLSHPLYLNHHATYWRTIHIDILKNISIDEEHGIKMQIYTGANVSIIPRNFGEKLGQPQLREPQLWNYDNSAKKSLSNLSACIWLKKV